MKTIQLIMCALFAALTAVLSQIAIPIGPIPINFATFSVFCAGALLGAKFGCMSQIVYVLLGAVGVPVFSMFRGGLGILVGPTGGYIAGYILAAWVIGFIAERYTSKIHIYALAMVAGFATYMVMGTCWFMFITKTGFAEALMICVAPFLLGDALKIALAATLAYRLRPILHNKMQRVQGVGSKEFSNMQCVEDKHELL